MLMGLIWTAMIVVSILFGCLNGTVGQVQQAALEGAHAAIRIVHSYRRCCLPVVCGDGAYESFRACRSAVACAQADTAAPVSGKCAARGGKSLQPLSANVSANLLGLGNAATPMGIRAAQEMARLASPGEASNELCRLVVLNTASIQLLPTTVAAIRAAEGATSPFDILPAVWISSAVSVAVGLAAACAMERRP